MITKKLRILTLVIALLAVGASAMATTIMYDLTNLGGNNYRYNWTVINNPLSVDIEDFVVYFSDVTVPEATNLAVGPSVPTNWTDQVTPESGGPTPLGGYYEAWWTGAGSGIAPGNSLGGFAATFTWTGGSGGPGSQYFEVYDSAFNVIDSGHTVLNTGVVPEWNSLLLGLIGLIPCARRLRRRA